MRIVLISGKRGSGKDTLAKVINKTIGENTLKGKFSGKMALESTLKLNESSNKITIVKFADTLRYAVLDGLMGLDSNDIENYDSIKDDESKIEHNGCIRDYMINVSKVVRDIDSDFFVRRLCEKLYEYDDNPHNQNVFLCTDWRYPNEYEYLENKGINVIKVRLNREKNPLSCINHHSETSLDNYPMDYIIDVIE